MSEHPTTDKYLKALSRGEKHQEPTDKKVQIRTRVEEFQILPVIQLLCLECDAALEVRRFGLHHMSSSLHCQECEAYYTVEWKDPAETPLIELVQEQ